MGKKITDFPPKSHNLLFLVEKIGIELPEEKYNFLYLLNQMSVTTRYPESLAQLSKDFNQKKTSNIIKETEELVKWFNQLFRN